MQSLNWHTKKSLSRDWTDLSNGHELCPRDHALFLLLWVNRLWWVLHDHLQLRQSVSYLHNNKHVQLHYNKHMPSTNLKDFFHLDFILCKDDVCGTVISDILTSIRIIGGVDTTANASSLHGARELNNWKALETLQWHRRCCYDNFQT